MQVDSIRYELDTILDAGGRPMVGQVSLEWARPGDCCTLIGETGSGKSLVAQSLLGLLPALFVARGTLRIGSDVIALDDRAGLRALWARLISLVPQEPGAALDPTMRLKRQLRHVKGASGTAIGHVLGSLGLPREVGAAFPFQLSGGMAQRALFATALLGRASLIVADEPTKGLDDRRAAQSFEALARLRTEGRCLLVITHDLSLACRLGGLTAVMKEGRVIEAAGAEDLFTMPRHDYTRDLLNADPQSWPRRETWLPSAGAVAELRNVSFAYGASRPIVEDLSFAVAKGEVVAVVGESGVGKTTIGNMLLGLNRPQRGSVLWNGVNIDADRSGRSSLRRKFQKLHQDPGAIFARHRTIGQHFADLADFIRANELQERLDSLLQRMRLAPKLLGRTVGEVSGGEAQRLALARILLLDPALIVADEPSSRLDPIVQRDVFDVLEKVREQQETAIVLISHQRSLVKSIAHRVVEIEPIQG